MQGCPWPFPCATIKVILLIIEGLLCVYMCKDNEIYNYNKTVLTFYYNLAFPVFAAAWSELITYYPHNRIMWSITVCPRLACNKL